MSNKSSIIPEFMAKNPDDTFQLLMPLKLKDEDKYSEISCAPFCILVS